MAKIIQVLLNKTETKQTEPPSRGALQEYISFLERIFRPSSRASDKRRSA
jgi:hypothetical protein